MTEKQHIEVVHILSMHAYTKCRRRCRCRCRRWELRVRRSEQSDTERTEGHDAGDGEQQLPALGRSGETDVAIARGLDAAIDALGISVFAPAPALPVFVFVPDPALILPTPMTGVPP